MAAPFGADADAQAGQTAADDENVSIDYFHDLTSFVKNTVNKSEIRISKPETNPANKSKIKSKTPNRNKLVYSFCYFDHMTSFRISNFVLRTAL